MYGEPPTRLGMLCETLATFGVYESILCCFACMIVVLNVSVIRSIFQRPEFLHRALPESGYKSHLSPLVNSHVMDI